MGLSIRQILQHPRMQEVKYAVVMVVVVGAVVGVIRLNRSEISVCQEVFRGLVRGQTSVQRSIDWNELNALGVDIGKTYQRIPGRKDRATYKRMFIENFAKGFRSTGAQFDTFTDWRVAQRTGDHTIIAVDHQQKQRTLLFAVPHGWRKRVTAIRWAS